MQNLPVFVNQLPSHDTHGAPKASQPSEDLVLARRAAARESQAVETFVRRMNCIPRILQSRSQRFGLRLGADEIDDASQQVFALVWQKLPEYRGEASLETWVFPFCSLTLMGLAKRHRRSPGQMDEAQESLLEERDNSRGVGEQLDDVHLHAALARLPADERAVVQLKQFDELTFEEIAARLSISANTAKSRYYRGLVALRESLSRLKGGFEG